MNLRTKTILLGTLAGLTFSTPNFASTKVTTANTDIELNILLEIEQNLQLTMAELSVPTINSNVAKQLQHGFLELQTNQLVKNARKELPKYKLKVILTE